MYTELSIREAIGDLERMVDKPLDEESLETGLGYVFGCLARAWHVRGLSQEEFERLTVDQAGWMRRSIPDLAPFWFSVVPAWTPIPDAP
jgi:hypothetical protein